MVACLPIISFCGNALDLLFRFKAIELVRSFPRILIYWAYVKMQSPNKSKAHPPFSNKSDIQIQQKTHNACRVNHECNTLFITHLP